MIKEGKYFLLILFLILPSIYARLDFEGWAYNVSNGTGTINFTFNYTTLLQYDFIQNESNIDIYFLNNATNKWKRLNATQNTTSKLLLFNDSGFPKLYRLGEIVTVAHDLQCLNNTSWVGCTSLVLNDTLSKVRVNCSDPHDWNINASFKLYEEDNNVTEFYANATSFNGNQWTLDNNDTTLVSGNFTLTATCIDNRSKKDRLKENWMVS